MEGKQNTIHEPLVPGISMELDRDMRVFIAYHARMGMKRRTLSRLLKKKFQKRINLELANKHSTK